MITGIAHICFVVKDLEKSIAFYRDQLGLTPAFDFINNEGKRFGVYLKVGGRTFIELFQGQVTPPSEGASYRHLCLEVYDIQDAVAKLRAGGTETGDPKLGSDQSWQAWLKDPEGNPIELHQYTPKSRQAPHLG